MIRSVAMAALAGSAVLYASAAFAQDEDYPNPNAGTTYQPAQPPPLPPASTADPRGTYTQGTTGSRFQRRTTTPTPTPTPRATYDIFSDPQNAFSRSPSAPAPASTARAAPQTPATATAAGTAATAVAEPSAAVAEAASEVAPDTASSTELQPRPEANIATDLPVTQSGAEMPIVEGDQAEGGVPLWLIILALGAAAFAAGLAAAKILMPWPRPKVWASSQIIPRGLPAGTLSLTAPDIEVRANAERGHPVLAGGVTIDSERWGDE